MFSTIKRFNLIYDHNMLRRDEKDERETDRERDRETERVSERERNGRGQRKSE